MSDKGMAAGSPADSFVAGYAYKDIHGEYPVTFITDEPQEATIERMKQEMAKARNIERDASMWLCAAAAQLGGEIRISDYELIRLTNPYDFIVYDDPDTMERVFRIKPESASATTPQPKEEQNR